jgi:hypothetical protein
MTDSKSRTAEKYTSLMKLHGDKFNKWLQNAFLTSVSLVRFTANSDYAFEIMTKFEKEQNEI